MSSILCKKQRGDLSAFKIQVREDSIENPLRSVFVTKDTHGSNPSLYFPKRSFDKIGGAVLRPQGHLGFLNLLGIQPLPLKLFVTRFSFWYTNIHSQGMGFFWFVWGSKTWADLTIDILGVDR
jgi:hypothetical protein